MEILEKIQGMQAAGKDVISLALGEPDFDAPACVKKEVEKSVEENITKYTHSQGLLELREAIADHYRTKYRVTVSPDQILVASGTSPAMLLAFAALLDPDDELILPNPHYACYPNFVTLLGGRPVYVPVKEEEAFQYRPEAVAEKITPKTKGIVITSPANPTGTVMGVDTMKEMATLTEKGPYLVSDEIYHGLIYEGEEHTILEFTDRAFVLNGFSKSYAMTGFRLGYLIAPKEFIRPLQVMQQNLFISANSFVQRGGIVALRDGQADQERMRTEFAKRRAVLLAGVKKLGFGVVVEPTGAFYIFANAKKFTNDSFSFAMELLEKAGVGVTPGIDFGSEGEGYLRFSYANSLANIEEALRRLEKYL